MTNKIHLIIDKELADIFPGFFENRKLDLEKIEKYLTQCNFNQIKFISHQMAGNCGGYGMPHLGLLAAKMEILASNQNINSLQETLQEMKSYFQRIEISYGD